MSAGGKQFNELVPAPGWSGPQSRRTLSVKQNVPVGSEVGGRADVHHHSLSQSKRGAFGCPYETSWVDNLWLLTSICAKLLG